MQKSNAPTQLTVAFASGSGAGPVNAIPVAASGTAGAASWTTGFTSVNMEPIGSGGIPPFGADFNGLFNALSNAQIWEQSGYFFPYSSAFSTAVGGYPSGAVLQMASGLGFWLNQADNNTTNPDTSAGANWIEMCANAGASAIALSGTSVTATENQLGVPLLSLTGALTAACKLVLPLRNGASWKVINNTTGGQTVTVGGATGATITIAAGSTGAQEVFTDGTNFYTTSFNGAGVYLPIAGTAVAATAWATARTISMTGDVTWTSPAINGTANVTAAATISAGAVTLAKMANFQANSLMGNPTTAAATPQAITLGSLLQFNAAGSSINVAPIAASSLLGNATTSSAVPTAITLANGLQFSGSSLGMGAITPTSVVTTGGITAGNGLTIASLMTFNGSTNESLQLANNLAGEIYIDIFQTGSSTNKGTLNIGKYGGAVVIGNGTTLTTNANVTMNTASNSVTLQFYSDTANQMVLDCYQNGTPTTKYDIYLCKYGGTTRTGNLAINGTVTSTGTANFNTSDERLKEISPAVAEPIHRQVALIDYTRRDTGVHGRGVGAQTLQQVRPDFVHDSDCDIVLPDGTTVEGVKMVANDLLALEVAYWAAQEVDKLRQELTGGR